LQKYKRQLEALRHALSAGRFLFDLIDGSERWGGGTHARAVAIGLLAKPTA
jgi:hypothetical protein